MILREIRSGLISRVTSSALAVLLSLGRARLDAGLEVEETVARGRQVAGGERSCQGCGGCGERVRESRTIRSFCLSRAACSSPWRSRGYEAYVTLRSLTKSGTSPAHVGKRPKVGRPASSAILMTS